eukprot:TRINITY_DN4866_c0_g1_i4.p1 TRINITY_DN4866_c0_g1~~TRINITY_DN4866_c0_g1_i4.p1  ORF type:complete len:218 (+),score=38.50 TRINITY_DN4866_c0_g1_i4:49-702(+)
MVSRLTQEQREEIKSIFNLFDKDGNGTISPDELSTVMCQCIGTAPSQKVLNELMQECDADGNGEIDLEEFTALLAKNMSKNDDYLLEAFKIFDRDDNGIISVAELKYVVQNLEFPPPDDQLERMIHQVDAKHDGNLCYVEFIALMAPHGASSGGYAGSSADSKPETAANGYKFGDVTKFIYKEVTGKEYKFGDITKKGIQFLFSQRSSEAKSTNMMI